MERYKNVEEFLADYNLDLTLDKTVISKLQKLANRVLDNGLEKTKEIDNELGYISESAIFRGLYSIEKKLLEPWRDSAVSWKDDNNNVYSIIYLPAKYIGRPDIIRVLKEYFFK